MILAMLKKISHWIGRFLYLQLFISLAAFPLLLCWGLPISLLSPVGNLIFGPFLTIFLFLSSMLFFTELLYIPNSLIADLLDTFTKSWLWILNIPSHPWLFGFAKPSLALLIIIPLVALLIIHYKKFKARWQPIFCLSILLIGSCLFIKTAHSKTKECETVACNGSEVTLVHDDQRLILIDPGAIGKRVNAASWIEFTLIPHLIVSSGKTTIDDLILLQPGAMLFQAITTLITKIKVKKIYLVCWQGSLEKHEWRSFFLMREAAQEHNVIIERITNKQITLPVTNGSLTITPLKSQITQREITYPAIKVAGSIDDTKFTVTSKKHKPMVSKQKKPAIYP